MSNYRIGWKEKLMIFSERHHSLFAAVVLLTSFFVSSFVFFLLYASISTLYGSPAIRFSEPTLNIFHTKTGTWLQVGAEVESSASTWAHVSRELYLKSSNERIMLPSSEYYYPPGKHTFSAVYTLPMRVATGEWCLEYAIRYQKSWSVWERTMSTTLGCTHVEPVLNGATDD